MKAILRKVIYVPVYSMKDGEIAVIRKNPGQCPTIGAVVQRWGDHLIRLGSPIEYSWSNIFKGDPSEMIVEICLPGQQFEI